MFKVKEFRMKQNLSQNQLAKKANISQSLLSDIESEKVNPTVKTIIKLAQALEVSITDLLENELEDKNTA